MADPYQSQFAELALVRISHLEDLDELSNLIAQLESGVAPGQSSGARPTPALSAAGPGTAKKKYEPSLTSTPEGSARVVAPPVDEESAAAPSSLVVALTTENAAEIWSRALSRLSGMVVEQAQQFDSLAIPAPNRLVIRFKPGYAVFKSTCERPAQVAMFEQALADVTGQRVRVEFAISEDRPDESQAVAPVQAVSQHQRLMEVMKHPLVQRAGELFGAQPMRVDEPSSRE